MRHACRECNSHSSQLMLGCKLIVRPIQVSLSSSAHRRSPVHFDDLDLKTAGYDPWVAYGQSKTANIYLANEIERRYGSQGEPLLLRKTCTLVCKQLANIAGHRQCYTTGLVTLQGLVACEQTVHIKYLGLSVRGKHYYQPEVHSIVP